MQITTTPEYIKNYSDNNLQDAMAYADEIGKRATGSIDGDGNIIITFGEQLWTTK